MSDSMRLEGTIGPRLNRALLNPTHFEKIQILPTPVFVLAGKCNVDPALKRTQLFVNKLSHKRQERSPALLAWCTNYDTLILVVLVGRSKG